MTDVRPFRGLRFNQEAVPDLAGVLCPPYDVISPHEQHELYQRSLFNAVRLEYGETSPSDFPSDNRYTRAAATLSDWLARRILVQEPRPGFYLYYQLFEHEGRSLTRRALFARVRLHEWGQRIILPHEHTLGEPKEDRFHLLRATRVNVSPVLALYRDSTQLQQAFDGIGRRPPLVETKNAKQRHRLHLLEEKPALDSIGASFENEKLYVIDGHHRYETALAYREERRAQSPQWTGEEPENFVLMALVSLDDPGLIVLPTHRLLHTAPPPDFLARLGKVFRLDSVDNGWQQMRSALAEKGREGLAIGVAAGGRRLIAAIDADQAASLMPPDTPSSWRSLDTAVLRELVLRRLLGVDEQKGTSDQTVEFTHDGEEALRLVDSGECALAFLLNPTSPRKVLEVADSGERMPQKTTYLYPKVPTGLVMNPLFQ